MAGSARMETSLGASDASVEVAKRKSMYSECIDRVLGVQFLFKPKEDLLEQLSKKD